jgi:hypothetical protein
VQLRTFLATLKRSPRLAKGEPRKGTVDRLKLKLYPLAFAAVGVLASMGGYWKGR